MSMSFNPALSGDESNMLKEILGDDLKVTDGSTALLDTNTISQKLMGDVARAAKQVVTVEINEPGEIKTMSDGTRYEAGPNGWRKLAD